MCKRAGTPEQVLREEDVLGVQVATDAPALVHLVGHGTELQPTHLNTADSEVDRANGRVQRRPRARNRAVRGAAPESCRLGQVETNLFRVGRRVTFVDGVEDPDATHSLHRHDGCREALVDRLGARCARLDFHQLLGKRGALLLEALHERFALRGGNAPLLEDLGELAAQHRGGEGASLRRLRALRRAHAGLLRLRALLGALARSALLRLGWNRVSRDGCIDGVHPRFRHLRATVGRGGATTERDARRSDLRLGVRRAPAALALDEQRIALHPGAELHAARPGIEVLAGAEVHIQSVELLTHDLLSQT